MLNKSKLEGDILQIFSNPTDSYKTAADKFARAYASYVKDGTANSIPPSAVILPASEKAMAGSLYITYKTTKTYPAFAAQVTSSVQKFWAPLMVPGAFGTSTGTIVLTPPLLASLNTMLSKNAASVAAGNTITERQAAAQWASVLHTFTKTITVTFPGAPPVVFPFT